MSAPEPLSTEELEAITRSAAKVVEVFSDDWELHYSNDGDEVSCRTDLDNPFVGAYVEIFNTSQWPDTSKESPVAEFLGSSIVVVPRLLGEVDRLRSRAENAEAELEAAEVEQMRCARSVEALRVNRDQLKAKLRAADELIADLKSAREGAGE